MSSGMWNRGRVQCLAGRGDSRRLRQNHDRQKHLHRRQLCRPLRNSFRSIGNVHIGDSVIIGHGAVLNCRKIGDYVLVGMNATILHDAEIGSNCIIGAACLVGQG
jgi:carbonic anhydrase/acetyltransferase-like protein (isoleucine patch superfamily)